MNTLHKINARDLNLTSIKELQIEDLSRSHRKVRSSHEINKRIKKTYKKEFNEGTDTSARVELSINNENFQISKS